MKKFAILLAVLVGFAANVLADNVTPSKKALVNIHTQGSLVQVNVDKTMGETCKVKFFSPEFEIIHTEYLKDVNVKTFDIKELPAGNYIMKVELNGEDIYTTVVRK